MDDVALRAGVSRALVSLVMRDSPKVSDRSRVAVLTAAEELDYRPNLMARSLASRRTMTIGLVLNDLHNPFFPEIADGIRAGADEHGYRLLMNSGFLEPASERRAVEQFLELRADGIILVGPRLPTKAIAAAAESVPVVVVGRPLRAAAVDTVNNDEAAGASLVVDHLVSLGHERIAHIDGGAGAGAKERRAGFIDAMQTHGLEPSVVRGDFTEGGGERAAEHILALADRPSAVFAANDLTALGALSRLDEAGLNVPDDISLVGYDNVAMAALRHISLTTIDQPRLEMGKLAVAAIVERLAGDVDRASRKIVRPSLVVRHTTAKPAAARGSAHARNRR